MTPTSEPTMGEILRRLDEVSRQMIDLAREMKDDRSAAAATYVRQDVYFAQRQAMESMIADLHGDVKQTETNLGREIAIIKDDRKSDVNFRRQVWLTMGALAITTLVTIVIAILNFVGR
jgi:hypothetical protein